MARIANRFTDPKTAKTYDWEINHEEEDDFGKRRAITHGANTAETGLVRIQADDEPLIWKVRGHILTEAMVREMWQWWKLCKTQTILFRDFAGDEYEVIITEFKPRRQRAVRNPKDLANAELHTWVYELEMEVVGIRSGPLEGISP